MAHDERVALGGDRLKRLVAAVFQILGVWHLSVAALMHIRDRLDRGAQGFVAPPSVAKQGGLIGVEAWQARKQTPDHRDFRVRPFKQHRERPGPVYPAGDVDDVCERIVEPVQSRIEKVVIRRAYVALQSAACL